MLDFSTDEKPVFEFAVNGDAYAVPRFDALPVDAVMSLLKEQHAATAEGGIDAGNDVVNAFIRALFDEHAPGACELLTVAQYRALMDAYMAASGVDVGES